MKRVAVIGSGGSGKSSLARDLGRQTGLPVIHLDRLYWGPNWTPMPDEAWATLQREIVAADRWIIDGHYGGTLEIRLEAADTVIFLDLPRLVCLWSVVRRRFSSARRGRPDMAEGLADRLELEFLRWIWNFPRNRRPIILAAIERLPALTRVIRLTSRRTVREYLDRVA